MSSSELCDWLLQATLASTAAIVLVLLLCKQTRSTFSPGVPMQCGVVTLGKAPGLLQMASPGNEPCP